MELLEDQFRTTVTCQIAIGGNLHWSYNQSKLFGKYDEEGLYLSFPISADLKKRNALLAMQEVLTKNNITWLYDDSSHWIINLDSFFSYFPNLKRQTWLTGVVESSVEFDIRDRMVFDKPKKEAFVQFIVTEREIIAAMPKRIFLSHKGVNKPMVREYFTVLKTLGFDPWLDEDAMIAGMPLDRALLNGMKESCAAVFFVTPDYKDEKYLADEIDYAKNQKREKGDKFSIITLVLKDAVGNKGIVPELLKKFVWKEPNSEIGGLIEILKALPICVAKIDWRQK